MLPIFQALFDLIGKCIWPIFFVWLLLNFNDDIRALLPRIRKLGSNGLELDTLASNQMVDEKNSLNKELSPNALKDFPGLTRSPAISEVEIALHQSLDKQLANQNLQESDKVDYLIRELAVSRLVSHFLRVYNIIFGSQIRGLQLLNQRDSVHISEAQSFFEIAKASDPQFYGNYKFEDWLNFLVQAFFIHIDNDQISITPAGLDFLQFLLAYKFNIEKRG
jgi:hypothetical protein